MLNQKQQEADDAVTKQNHQIVTLIGGPGTGKSYTTAAIIRNIFAKVLVTATTHAAKDNLAKMARHKVITTQAAMGFVLMRDNYKMKLAQVNPPKPTDLLIVEEISMLPVLVYEAILVAIEEGRIGKVLFLGDPLQLPSVDKSVDVATIPGLHITLTEQKRQDKADTSTLDYLDRLRQAIADGEDLPSLKELDNIHTYQKHDEFANAYLSSVENKVVLAYRNKVVDKYNAAIHAGDNQFNKGDIVILDKPLSNGKFTIANNGAAVSITEIKQDSKYPRLIISVVTTTGAKSILHFWTSKSELEDILEKLKEDEQEEQYWEIADNSFRLKHEYASTVFKAQGKSITEVFIDAADMWSAHSAKPSKYNHPIDKDMFLRLLYVAISRMELKAHLFIGTIRSYSYFEGD